MNLQLIGLIVVIISLGIRHYSGIFAALLAIFGLCLVVKGNRSAGTMGSGK